MWVVGTPWATCQSPWMWLLPSMHWAAPGSPVDVPKLPLQPWATLYPALASAPHLFPKGSHLRAGDSPPVQAHSCGFALHGAPLPSIKLTLTLAWPASPSRVPTGKQGTGWGRAGRTRGAGWSGHAGWGGADTRGGVEWTRGAGRVDTGGGVEWTRGEGWTRRGRHEGRGGAGWGGAGWGGAGRGGAGQAAGGSSLAQRARTVLPHRRLFVFITNSIFKTRPAAAELSGSPFLCLQRSPPPLAPPLTNPAILMENSLVSPSPSRVPRQLRA